MRWWVKVYVRRGCCPFEVANALARLLRSVAQVRAKRSQVVLGLQGHLNLTDADTQTEAMRVRRGVEL